MEPMELVNEIMRSVDRMIDPHADLEQRLAQMKAQVDALAQLPRLIQQKMDMVTQQINQFAQMESFKEFHEERYVEVSQQRQETINATQRLEEKAHSVEITEIETPEKDRYIEIQKPFEYNKDEPESPSIRVTKPSLTEEELGIRREEVRQMLEEKVVNEKEITHQVKVETPTSPIYIPQAPQDQSHQIIVETPKPPIYIPQVPQEITHQINVETTASPIFIPQVPEDKTYQIKVETPISPIYIPQVPQEITHQVKVETPTSPIYIPQAPLDRIHKINVETPTSPIYIPQMNVETPESPIYTPQVPPRSPSPRPQPAFGPAPKETPLPVQGTRKWKRSHEEYDEEMIQETLTAQAEVIKGKAIGVNFMKFEKPPPALDHLRNSEVFKLIHNADEAPVRKVEALRPVVAEADYRERARSLSPFPNGR